MRHRKIDRVILSILIDGYGSVIAGRNLFYEYVVAGI
jgi:hypothetical protein